MRADAGNRGRTGRCPPAIALRARADFQKHPPDPDLARGEDLDVYMAHCVLPCRRLGPAIALAAVDHGAAMRALPALSRTAPVVEIALAERADIEAAIRTRFGGALARRAAFALSQSAPQLSAASGTPVWMTLTLAAGALLLAAALLWDPAVAAAAILILGTALAVGIGALRIGAMLGMAFAPRPPTLPEPEAPAAVGPGPPPAPPTVTVLIAVYREARSIPILIEALIALDYPKHALDVKILIEADDAETLAAFEAVRPPQWIEALTIPDQGPRTKPKALNYALPFARGEILGVFDAEDMPESDQIRRAVDALAAAPEEVVCAQSRLNHYNASDNWLTRCAAMEYALWFDLVLPALSHFNLPIPLGGTSLYFRTKALRALGGWDPHNVTEDADLGVRLARRGWRAITIASTTWEEANTGLKAWIRQRSRWIKGFLITWMVHMRRPRALWRDLGPGGFLAANLVLLDGVVSYVAQPLFAAALVWGAASGSAPWAGALSAEAGRALIVLMAAPQAGLLLAATVAAKRRFGWRRALLAPTLWLYWMLGAAAAFKAFREAALRPWFWDKTAHCVSPRAEAFRQAALLRSARRARPLFERGSEQ